MSQAGILVTNRIISSTPLPSSFASRIDISFIPSMENENGFSLILWSSSGEIVPSLLIAPSMKLESHFFPKNLTQKSNSFANHLSRVVHVPTCFDSLWTSSKAHIPSSATICAMAHCIASENRPNLNLSSPISPSISNDLALNFSRFFGSPLLAAFSRNAVICFWISGFARRLALSFAESFARYCFTSQRILRLSTAFSFVIFSHFPDVSRCI